MPAQMAQVDVTFLVDANGLLTLSARELQPALLPANAQTWVNWHVLFTHGNGAVMSPLARKTKEGLPVFYLQDIPPVATEGPPIDEPRIMRMPRTPPQCGSTHLYGDRVKAGAAPGPILGGP